MSFEHAYIPYGAYWSTPFCRWQGSLANENSIELAARTARRALEDRGISPEAFDGLSLGITVPQRHSFYGAPWLAGMIGAPSVTGATIAQACATSARLMASIATEVETGQRQCMLTVACDRLSNGPHIYYPDPQGMGGRGETEEPVWESFQHDPWARQAMIETAENVARQESISREEQDQVTLSRFGQYQEALAQDRAFQRRYMVAVEVPEGKKRTRLVETDEGIHPTTAEGLARLRPVLEDGTVTFGSQTHPADGNAGLVRLYAGKGRRACRRPRRHHSVAGFRRGPGEEGIHASGTSAGSPSGIGTSGSGLQRLEGDQDAQPVRRQ